MASSSKCSQECNRLVFEAVDESSDSKLKLVIRAYSESELLISLAQCNEKGETPLGVAMNGKNVDLIDVLVKFLLKCECLDHDYLFHNAIDQLSHQIPIIKLIDLLVDQLKEYYNTDWLVFLADVFSWSSTFTRQDKITALEIIGAMLIINLTFSVQRGCAAIQQTELGLQYWRDAMSLRYFSEDDEPLLPKISDVGVPSVASSVVFGSAVEVMSMEELDLLEGHFKRNFTSDQVAVRLSCKKLMQLQALLVIRRISSQANHELPHSLYLQSLLRFGTTDNLENETNPGSSALVINTFLLILEQMTDCDPKLLSRNSFEFFMCSLHNMSLSFIKMLQEPPDSPGRQELSCANFLAPTKFLGTIAMFFPEPAMISSDLFDYSIFGVLRFLGDFENHRSFTFLEELDDTFNFAELVFNFMAVFESISPRLSSQEKQHLEDYYSNIIRDLFTERTTTVLHAAVGERENDGLQFRFRPFQTVEDFKPMIKLILKLGADPNAIDRSGRTPLHVLAQNERYNLDENLPIFQALVNAGTHLDIASNDGETVLNFVKAASRPYYQNHNFSDPYYESLISHVFPLSCHCARVILRHKIRYDNWLPPRLQTFVSRHSAKDPKDLPAPDY